MNRIKTSAFLSLLFSLVFFPISLPCYGVSNTDLTFEDGVKLLNGNDYDGAIEKFTKIIRLNKNSPSSYLNKGAALYGKKDYEGAIKEYNKAFKILRNPLLIKSFSSSNIASLNILFYLNRGAAYYSSSEFKLAEKDFENAIISNPLYNGIANPNPLWLSQLSSAYSSLGDVYISTNQHDKAIENYNKALEINNSNINSYLNRAIAYYQKKDYQNALKDVQRSIKKIEGQENINNKMLARAYNKMGIIYLAEGLFDKSIESFNISIKHNPEDGSSHYNKGIVYRDLAENKLALEEFNTAVKIYQQQGNEVERTKVVDAIIRLNYIN
jgi:tetratricopeptide (TPR) repeat protein